MQYGFFVAFTGFIFLVNLLLIIRAYITYKEDKIVNTKKPSVSIIVPAFNEEAGIVASVNSLLKQTYPNFNIVVVNDGSTDNTQKLLEDNYFNNPRVTLLEKSNGGKASALNFGVSRSSSDYIMCIDGDTVLVPKCVETLVGKLKNGYDAIAPMVGIANGQNIINSQPNELEVPKKISARMQWVEYMRSYIIFRCSVKSKNCITVISGACGMISRTMFNKTGGYKEDNLGEDMELTMNIHYHGGKIQFLAEILSWTEAPDNIKELGKQRHRWFRGSLQSLSAYSKLLFGKRNFTFKWLMLPYIWISDVFGVWVELSAWIYTIYLLCTDQFTDWYGFVALWTIILLGHYLNSVLVMMFANRKIKYHKRLGRAIGISMIEGFTYHFLYVYWIVKAHLSEIFKTERKWNKLERKGVLDI